MWPCVTFFASSFWHCLSPSTPSSRSKLSLPPHSSPVDGWLLPAVAAREALPTATGSISRFEPSSSVLEPHRPLLAEHLVTQSRLPLSRASLAGWAESNLTRESHSERVIMSTVSTYLLFTLFPLFPVLIELFRSHWHAGDPPSASRFWNFTKVCLPYRRFLALST